MRPTTTQITLLAAVTLDRQGKVKEARAAVSGFLDELCNTTVLDPACGSGNFLYVTLEHMKRLEAEVRQTLVDLGGQDVLEGTGLTVDPHLLKGVEPDQTQRVKLAA